MSSDETRITPAELVDAARPVHVDKLTAWEGPWPGDVGARAVTSSEFGHIELVYTYGDEVLHGQDVAQAERIEPRDGGMVPAVDLAGLGLSRERAELLVVAIRTRYADDAPDRAMLAELLASAAEVDPAGLLASGWDSDKLDALIESAEVPEVPDFQPVDEEDQPRLDQKSPITCPHCAEEFVPA